MARIALIELEPATPGVKEIYEQKLKGKPGNVQKAAGRSSGDAQEFPRILRQRGGFYASVGRSLDRKLYELIYIRVSMINGCRYCLQHHLASSKRVGLTPEDWALPKEGNYSRYIEKERVALTYTEKLTRSPHEITDSNFNELKKNFTDAEIVDIHLLTGLAPYQPGYRPAAAGVGNVGRKNLAPDLP